MSRFRNLLGAAPLIAWYAWGLSRELPALFSRYSSLLVGGHIDAVRALQTVTEAVSIVYIGLLILLLIVRETPHAQTKNARAYLAAYIGTFAIASFYVLPTAVPTTPVLILATLCIAIGLGLSLATLIYLGRSFAILPSARTLITGGPYRLIRHPLYLSEEMVVVGIMLQFAEPWALVIVAVHLAAQFARMHYEEQTLTASFPAYTAYAARTSRLIPGLY